MDKKMQLVFFNMLIISVIKSKSNLLGLPGK